MKNLRVWQKIAVMGAVCLLPFAVVTWKMMAEVNARGVVFVSQELRGLDYYGPVLRLQKDLQQHSVLSVAVLAGDTTAADRLAAAGATIEQDLTSMQDADRRLGAVLHTTKRWSAVDGACRDLLGRKDLSAETSQDLHVKVLTDVAALIGDVGDASNMSRDPSVDTYYLMNFLILKGPELTNVLSQARGISTVMAVRKGGPADQLDTLRQLRVLPEFLQNRLDKSLAKALAFNDTLKPDLETEIRLASESVYTAVAGVQVLLGQHVAGSAADDASGALSRAIDRAFALETRVTRTLDGLLNTRVAEARREVRNTFVAVGFALLVMGIVGLFMSRDITSRMQEVVAVADLIAAGDVSVRNTATSRRDEIGDLARAFDRMAATVKETVATAEQIAAGDLSVAITPRSDRDLMGGAMSNMVGRLSALVGNVQQSGIQVNSSVMEISATAKEQQATASEIAATTIEIGATSREISATSSKLAGTITELATVADQSATIAGQGQAGLTRMEDTMRRVVEAAGSISAKFAVLSERAANISQVVTTITKVADQTNLLSLNAAIEAEKAGEYGRGFAVVATEIRRLADQTAIATYDIEQIVKEIQSAVAAGVMGMDRFSEEVRRGMHDVQQVGAQLSQVISQVQALAPRVELVNEGMQAQASGAGQITQALAQLSEAAQQTVDSLRQAGLAIGQLNTVAADLRTGVSRFKLRGA